MPISQHTHIVAKIRLLVNLFLLFGIREFCQFSRVPNASLCKFLALGFYTIYAVI